MASRHVWWRIAIAAASLLAVLAAAGVWAAVRAGPVREELLGVAGLLTTLQQQLDAGDLASTRTTLSALQDQTAAARSRTGGIDWRAASHAPGLGTDIGAVRTVAEVLDDLSHQALPIMVDLAGSLDLTALVPQAGHLDLDPLRAAAPRLAAAQASVETAAERIDAIDSDGLMPPLRDAVTRLQGGLEKLRALTRDAVRASVLLPSMLGGDGPRTYLVLMQNLAEVRATGGMPGAFLVIRADHGTLSLVDQGSAAAALQVFPEPVLPLSDAQLALYSERLGIYPADVNFTPHFPTAALLAREMYRRRSGTTVDGVLATDPVALSYLLRVTGPMTVPNGPSLTADNAVRVLLSEAYATMTGPEQDQYFAAAARTVFEALTQHTTEPRGALAALARATNERRLLVWSAHPEEQRAIEGTMLEGSLPEREDGGQTTVGVFLNDGSGAKLGYYLTHSAALTGEGCRPDGRRVLRLEINLGSTAPPNGLPADVLGLGLAGDPYTVRTNVMVFSPAGGAIMEMALDGAPVSFAQGTERRRFVAVRTVDLRPGQTRTVTATLLTAPHSGPQAALWVTPGVNTWNISHNIGQTCPNVD